MRRVYYNKLIRDGIPGKIEEKGEAFEVREITDNAELEQELLKKVVEEAQGLSRVSSRADLLDEYADLMVVLDELMKLQEFSEADIRTAIEENLARKGGYVKRLYLAWSEDASYTSNETPQGIST